MQVQMPDGTILSGVPEGTTKSELLRRYELYRKQNPIESVPVDENLTERDRWRQQIGQQFGLDPSQVDLSQGLPFLQRTELGLLADPNAGEVPNLLGEMYPGQKIANLGGGQYAIGQGQGQSPLLLNPPGFDRGDVGQFLGEVGPATVGALVGAPLAAATTPFTGPGGPIVGATVGATVGEGAREGLQKLLGTSRETPAQYLQRALISGGIEAATGGLGLGVAKGLKALFRRGAKAGTDKFGSVMATKDANELQEIMKWLKENEGIALPDLMNYQKTDNKIVDKFTRQVMQFDDEAQQRAFQQLEQLRSVMKGTIPETGPSSADEILRNKLSALYSQKKPAKASPTVTGAKFQESVDQGLAEAKGLMQDSYNRDLYPLLDKYQPKYDIGPAQKIAVPREVAGEGAEGAINVAANEQGLAPIYQKIQALDPLQGQPVEVVRELRSQVGQLRDLPLAKKLESGVDPAKASELYDTLSRILENPQGVTPDQAAEIVSAARKSNRLAKSYYDNYDKTDILRVINSTQGGTPTQLGNYFTEHPAAIEKSLRDIVEKVPSKNKTETVGVLRKNLDASIMASDDPYKVLNTWEEKAPDALKWLYPTDQKLSLARQTAKEFRDLNSGPMREAFDMGLTRVGFAEDVLKQASAAEPSRGGGRTAAFGKRSGEPLRNLRAEDRVVQLMKQVGGVESDSEARLALREGLISDVIQNSMKEHPKGGLLPESSRANRAISKLEESPYWNTILTPRDRKALQAFKSYARRAWNSGDAGTGLAVASQIGQLRKGDLGALASTVQARTFARMLTSTDVPFSTWFNRSTRSGRETTAFGYARKAFFTSLRQDLGRVLPEQEDEYKATR